MAVTIDREPAEISTVLPSLEWWLTQTSAPGANEEIYLFYRVNVDGSFLTEASRAVRYTPHPAKLDFGRMVLGTLSNPIKALDDVTASTQTESKVDVYVEYGETTVDLTTGGNVISGPFNTNTVAAIFGAFNPNQEDVIDPAGNAPIILSNKPARFKVARDQSDWIYVCGNFTVNTFMQIIGYNSAGSPVFSSSARQLGSGHYVGFPVGGANAYQQTGGIGADVCYMEVTLGEGDLVTNAIVYRIDVYDCEDVAEAELYFREPQGGWSSIRFEKADISAVRTLSNYDQYYDRRGALSSRRGAGGLAASISEGRLTAVLSKRLNQESILLADYYAGALATKEHYLRRKDASGNYVAERVELVPSESSLSKVGSTVDFTVTCRLAKPMESL